MRKYGIHYVQVRHSLCASTAFTMCKYGIFYAQVRHFLFATSVIFDAAYPHFSMRYIGILSM